MIRTSMYRISLFLLFASLSSCGGGGGSGLAVTSNTFSSGGGIGGSGITSTGTVDGFGSIFVNGIEFETEEATIFVDGDVAAEDALKLGMVVTVSGTVNEDGTTGIAQQVVFDDEVQGPIATLQLGPDGDSLLMLVLGLEVIVERTSTVFDGVSFDTLDINDVVEVSGFRINESQLRATRVEKKSDFIPGTSEVEVKGVVTDLTDTEFRLNEFIVDFSNADLSDVTGGKLTEGATVEVYGTLDSGIILALRIETEGDPSDDFDEDDEISVQGAITDFVSTSQFKVNGVAVDASDAALLPTDLILADGVIVEAEGPWNGNLLVAEEIKSRRGRIEIEASVAAVNSATGTITLQFHAGSVTVQVDSTTLLEDDTERADPLTLGDISIGDFLVVEAVQIGDTLLATRIDRDEPDDNILQAQVEAFNAGVDIKLLGIVFSTADTEFENQYDEDLSPEAFYGQLKVGDLIKVKDERAADGVAEEVEFEQEGALDGSELDGEDDCDTGPEDECEPKEEEEPEEEQQEEEEEEEEPEEEDPEEEDPPEEEEPPE
jgi:hypothetical protein